MPVKMTSLKEWALTPLRLVAGLVFLMHGWQKLFVHGVGGVGRSFGQIGIPLPELMAVVVSVTEFGGGLALILGLLTRWVSIPLAVTMLVATFQVHWKNGFFLPRGYEFSLTLLAATLALALAGPGPAALDHLIRRGRGK